MELLPKLSPQSKKDSRAGPAGGFSTARRKAVAAPEILPGIGIEIFYQKLYGF
jgi:hypothetical protein